MAQTETSPGAAFSATFAQLNKLAGFLATDGAMAMEHSEIEAHIWTEGMEVLRLLFQDHFDLRAVREPRLEDVVDAHGVAHGAVETGQARDLESRFGTVVVGRSAYRHKGADNLYPADATANLPPERYSHGLRELAAIEASRGSFAEATAAIPRTSAAKVPKRQVEALTRRAAVDFDAFFYTATAPVPEPDDVVVLSADGKGIVMRPDGLRAATAARAAQSESKLRGRLSKGEKRDRKRMAEVGAVYVIEPVPRRPADVMAHRGDGPTKEAPRAVDKWLTASVAEDTATVISRVFDEAERRDPDHSHVWVALVDGNNHQIHSIEAEAAAREIDVVILCDWIHVLEYLWSSAWSFFTEGDPAAEEWVHEKAIDVLSGRASIVAAAIRRKATTLDLDDATRKNADVCADYLLAKVPYLDYPTALAAGWPIGTGVIEGAVRHVVRDRMDVTGARWGLEGAEAVLKLRALRANDCWAEYWPFHLAQERMRVHESRYLDGVVPMAA
ncbi:MAG: ISKra4 family transposase [Acidimicrobiales bacterium]